MKQTYSLLLKELTAITTRRGYGEQKACEVIISHLRSNLVNFELQIFDCEIPLPKSVFLTADGINIPCVGSSFVSGKFDKSSQILNVIGVNSEKPAIVFHPLSEGVCLQEYKDFPCISVNKNSVQILNNAKKISGEVVVDKLVFKSTNIIVGNTENPKIIIFAHYDSLVGPGAVDNAGSVDVIFNVILKNKVLLEDILFVFIGSEEASFSSRYGLWGFEMFGKKYGTILECADEIIILDGVGVGDPSFTTDNIDSVFEISDKLHLNKKAYWMQNDQDIVMRYYHSEIDTIDKLKINFLNQAYELLLYKINQHNLNQKI